MLKEKVTFLGLGGCGSNLAHLFQQKGYNVYFLNGSTQDISSLAGARNILTLRNYEGFGGDRKIAERALANNLELIDELRKIKEEIVFLIFSTAGSTGSGLAPIILELMNEIAVEQGIERKVCCIAVLPQKDEPMQKIINGYECLKELSEITDMGSCILVDNNKANSIERINVTVVNQLHYFLSDESYSKRGNFDVAERMRVLKERGVLLLSVVCMSKAKSPEYMQSLLVNNMYAPVENDGVVEYIAVINSTEDPVNIADIERAVGTPVITFIGYGSKKTITVLSGLSYPVSYLSELLNSAERKFQSRMDCRNKVGGKLREVTFSAVPIVEEKPFKKKLSRLEMLRNLNGKVTSL